MLPLLAASGSAVALIGSVGLLWVRRRRFRRRNQHGVEMYRSYGHMVTARAVDATATAVAALLVCAGGAIALFSVLRLE